MTQNTRRNKTNQTVEWPTTSYFTISELAKLNPKMLTVSGSDITLRVRLSNAIEDGNIVEIGSKPGGKGRPIKVFAATPLTQNVLNKAIQNNINLVDKANTLVNVVNVRPPAVATRLPVPTT